jgi:dihydroanticapsin dehydrogenase
MRLEGKVALITGGGTGIGEETARRFAAEGAAIVITGRRKEVLDGVVSQIKGAEGRALGVAGSVTDEDHVRSAVEKTINTFGRLDILVNNAASRSKGYRLAQKNFSADPLGQRLHLTTDETWDDLMAVNLGGVFRFTRAAIPHMLDHGGSIVNISSIAAVVGIMGAASYAATKGGLIALSRAIAVEYGKERIRCNCLCPGLVHTPATAAAVNDAQMLELLLPGYPIGRIGTAEDVANFILFLASDESSWVTGGLFIIDGGVTASMAQAFSAGRK